MGSDWVFSRHRCIFLQANSDRFFSIQMKAMNFQETKLEFHKLWYRKLYDSINFLAVGKPFLEELSEENDILIGTTAGRVLILNETKVRKETTHRYLQKSRTDSLL